MTTAARPKIPAHDARPKPICARPWIAERAAAEAAIAADAERAVEGLEDPRPVLAVARASVKIVEAARRTRQPGAVAVASVEARHACARLRGLLETFNRRLADLEKSVRG